MIWEEYLVNSEKTLSREFHDDEKIQKLLHSFVGMLTEINEINDNYDEDGVLVVDTNKQGSVAEEISDLSWYLAIPFREYSITRERGFGYSVESHIYNNPAKYLRDITRISIDVLDILKKRLFYNKQFPESLIVDKSIQIFDLVCEYCSFYDIDFGVQLDKNIEKLRHRYGDKFSSESANNRDLIGEKEILEK